MGKVLLVLLVLVVIVAGLGFYQGWFSFLTTRDRETGNTEIRLKIDEAKMKTDAERARKKLTGTGAGAEEKSTGK